MLPCGIAEEQCRQSASGSGRRGLRRSRAENIGKTEAGRAGRGVPIMQRAEIESGLEAVPAREIWIWSALNERE